MSYSFPTNQPDGTQVTLANGVTYQYDLANDRWLVRSVQGDVDGPDLGDLLWEEIDTGSNQNPPLALVVDGSRPTGGGTEGLLNLWHGDPADATTSPNQEFKVWMTDGGASIVDKYDHDGIYPWFEIRQGDKAMRMKGSSGGWTTHTKTYHVSTEEVTGDVLSDGPCELWLKYDDSPILDLLDDRYVNKEGGDFMEGPLDIRKQDGTGSRDTNKVKTLGVYSGSDDALRLGTNDKTDRVYVGKNDTSFNGPIKVDEIVERNDGQGTTVTDKLHLNDTLIFGPDHSKIAQINPAGGTIQEIELFTGNSGGQTLRMHLQGATYNNAMEFYAGPSAGKDVSLRLDSNKGIRAKNLSAWDTNIKDVADPVNDKDAVNLKSVQDAVGDLETRIRERLDDLIVETSSGQMKWQVVQNPMTAGTFTTYDRNGSTTYNIADTHDLQVNNTNLSGYDFHWDRLEPGMYLYMSGPLGLLVRFRVVAEPVDNGSWTSIKVADGFVSLTRMLGSPTMSSMWPSGRSQAAVRI